MSKTPCRHIINEKGKKTDVVLSIEEYKELMEYLHDLVVVAERRDEPSISLEELKNRLEKDGIV